MISDMSHENEPETYCQTRKRKLSKSTRIMLKGLKSQLEEAFPC